MKPDQPICYGLIGYPLSHSFSPGYFKEKFEALGLNNHYYDLFPIRDIQYLPRLLDMHPEIKGFNVTIPYKETVVQHLESISPEAEAISAVNTIKIIDGKCYGYNTDILGFEKSLIDFLSAHGKWETAHRPKAALILGTGGASKAVHYVLNKHQIKPSLVSRDPQKGDFTYESLAQSNLSDYPLIINTTPLGTAPKVELAPPIPFEQLTPDHLLYDLVYNPAETTFMKQGLAKGAKCINGLQMLHLQADAAWEIWSNA